MLVLKSKMVCPYSRRCPYVRVTESFYCEGTNKNRETTFHCEFARDDGTIQDRFGKKSNLSLCPID